MLDGTHMMGRMDGHCRTSCPLLLRPVASMRFDDATPPPIAARTLVVPTVSAANVPQLALDLFIHTHSLAHVGSVLDPAVLPAAGADALGNGVQPLSTSCELFCDAAGGVAILQLRAPLVPGSGPAFVGRVLSWARRALCHGQGGCVVWLHSSHPEEVGGGGPLQQHVGPTGADVEYAFTGSERGGPLASALGQLRWSAMPADDPRHKEGHAIHGIIKAAAGAPTGVEVVVLGSTVAEWNATQDGAALATSLSALLDVLATADGCRTDTKWLTPAKDWHRPPSWAGLLL